MKLYRLLAVLIALVLPTLAMGQTHKNVLNWVAPGVTSGTTITGYNLYKSVGSCTGTFVKLNTTLITTLTFTDSAALVDGSVSCYYLTTVSTGAMVGESTPSGMWLATTPSFTAPAPQPPPAPGAPVVVSN